MLSDDQQPLHPLVSVIIAAYNAERYIGAAIQSVLDQTVADLELVVVNDGSTDATERQARAFRDPRLRCISQINQGPSAARNAGLALCSGKYVAFLDADDVWDPNKLQRQLDVLVKENVEAVFTWIQVIDEDARVIDDSPLPAWFNRECPTQAEMVRKFFLMGNFLCASAGLIDASLLHSVGDFCLTSIQAQDFHMWLKLVKVARIAILPEPLVRYRVLSQSSITHNAANAARIRFENQQNYRTMFDGMPDQLFLDAFPIRSRRADDLSVANLDLEKAFLYLEHSEGYIRYIGIELLYALLQDPRVVETARAVYKFTLPDLFALTRDATATDVVTGYEAELKELRAWAADLQDAVRWNDEQRQRWQRLAEQRHWTLAAARRLKAFLRSS